jgi:hypothetical protein
MNPPPEHVRLLFFLFGGALVAAIAWVVSQPACDFRIDVRRNCVRIRGRFPASMRGDVARLLRDEMAIRRVTICGNWTPGRVLRLRFRGRLTEFERQRIRNYLVIVFGG